MQAQDAAARTEPVEVRALEQLADLRGVDALFESVWGTGIPILGVELLRALAHEGGYVSGAFLRGELVGASAGFLGNHGNRLSLHSHVTGVSPRARGSHVGRALKLHQREWAASHGIQIVTWTFDPLVRRNAWFNIERLGANAVEFHINFYGPLNDDINGDDETDRLLARWDIGAERVCGNAAEAIFVKTPEDIVQLRRSDPDAARAWRLTMREQLSQAFETHEVTGFTQDGSYTLTPRHNMKGKS